ncbi:MAG: molybdopterin-dependent oxidoreductase [Pseudomonadota bacterium]
MNTRSEHVICRACHAHCGLIVDFENDVPTATHGDKNNPAFHGYSCIKGRQLANYHILPTRLLQSQKRQANGSHAPIEFHQAANESADAIKAIIDEHGPDAVALYVGTFGYNNLASHAFAIAFMEALQSRMYFTSVTIDQPGKGVARAELGAWQAGPYRVSEWDGLMLVGTNPVVSHNGGLSTNPARQLHAAKKRGMELIVIDPRRTDCAAKADLFLQCRPGEDTAILGAIVRQILEDGAHDKDFIASNVDGLETLKQAVAPYDPRSAADRAGVSADDIVKAARMFGNWKRGHVSIGTGPNMSGYGNIVECLGIAMQSLMGHWRRAGEVRKNSGFFINPAEPVAAALPPIPANGFGKKLRVHGLEETILGMPTAALADEILMPGEGQIKALIVLGGNPMLAWPDQIKTKKAMEALDLLICIDPRMSKTAELADYVIAPKLHFEILGTTAATELFGGFGAGWGFEETYAQVSNPILRAPDGSDLYEDYEYFQAMATHLGKTLSVKSWALMNNPVAMESERTMIEPGAAVAPIEAWGAALNGSPVSVQDAFADPETHKGKILGNSGQVIREKPDNWKDKLSVCSPVMKGELERYARERLNQTETESAFPFKLISRRLSNIHNSNWHEDPALRRRTPHHPAFINPDDLATLKLAYGDVIVIESAIGAIKCVARSAPDVRTGCLSVPHAWGTTPDEKDDPLGAGGNTGRLSAMEEGHDKITGIPIMSAIPVRISGASAA